MKIIFPEITSNQVAQQAAKSFPDIEFVPANNLDEAVKALQSGAADSMISGLDYSSRDVLLAYKAHIPLASQFFSSCFICQKSGQIFALADGGINKLPTKELFYVIVEDTANTFQTYTGTTPRIAMLSYSTNGSGGKNPDLEKIHYVIDQIRQAHPDWIIDGEMQLDAAIDPDISAKKFPTSTIKGDANILITPDLNSGNILYKSLERFGGFTIAGPMIQGFQIPLADLSRGSTQADTELTIKVLKKLINGQSHSSTTL
jgi:phosphate acetyltransferase